MKKQLLVLFLLTSVMAFAQNPVTSLANAGQQTALQVVTPFATVLILWGILRAGLDWVRGGAALVVVLAAVYFMTHTQQVISWLSSL